MQITAVWKNYPVKQFGGKVNIFQVDWKYYIYADLNTKKSQVLEYARANPDLMELSTKAEIEKAGDPLHLLPIIKFNLPDWTVKICECGSEKVYGPKATHSHWCPKACLVKAS